MGLQTVRATRYVMPLREGGSLPGLVEADDDGLYVVKLLGAGQGVKALVAELLAGELARAVGLPVPELVLMELDPALGRAEPDPEIRDLLVGSGGTNLALDFLPGAIMFDAVAGPAPASSFASQVVMLDAVVLNVDRTPRNPNLLSWHGGIWLIDHGAALYFHHGWRPTDPLEEARNLFPEVRDHILLPWADGLGDAGASLREALTDARIDGLVELLPEAWLEHDPGFAGAAEVRSSYVRWLRARRDAIPRVLEEAERARAAIV